MCGITGLLHIGSKAIDIDNQVKKMTESLSHRGPDSYGNWSDLNMGVGLGHSRLAILDLSIHGAQPMHSNSGRYVISYNGEIYNHYDLRLELKAQGISEWNGHSDTETILNAICEWGIEETLIALSGMFALAIWDNQLRTLTLARDRFGEKPLYFGWSENSFLFGSQLKAFEVFPMFQNKISKEALAKYLEFNYVPAPLSIYEDIFKLEPGCYVQITDQNLATQSFNISQYWSLEKVIQKNFKKNKSINEVELTENLHSQLKKTISDQMLSDVPLGAFLSGGIDSSLIVSLMQDISSQPIKTFTIGFEDETYDESKFARRIAEHLGTDHREYIATAKDAQDVIKLLPYLYDEPFADSSQIPTYLVSKLAKKDVTVVLSGDAGDELFAGYNRYFWAPKIWSKLSWLPLFLRKFIGKLIYLLSVDKWNKIGTAISFVTFKNIDINRIGDKAYKLADRLRNVKNISDLYLSLVTEWDNSSFLIKDYVEIDNINASQLNLNHSKNIQDIGLNEIEKMMYLDSISYLPDDILCKVDRASMGVSLESRVPFLDPKIAEIAWTMPLEMKIKNGRSKSVLRDILHNYVPEEFYDRPKAGFGIPIGDWLRTDLKTWAESLLSESIIVQDGIFNYLPINKIWNEHLSGKRDWTHKLWSILMFQAWLHRNNS